MQRWRLLKVPKQCFSFRVHFLEMQPADFTPVHQLGLGLEGGNPLSLQLFPILEGCAGIWKKLCSHILRKSFFSWPGPTAASWIVGSKRMHIIAYFFSLTLLAIEFLGRKFWTKHLLSVQATLDRLCKPALRYEMLHKCTHIIRCFLRASALHPDRVALGFGGGIAYLLTSLWRSARRHCIKHHPCRPPPWISLLCPTLSLSTLHSPSTQVLIRHRHSCVS